MHFLIFEKTFFDITRLIKLMTKIQNRNPYRIYKFGKFRLLCTHSNIIAAVG